MSGSAGRILVVDDVHRNVRCRALREQEDTAVLPVMLTASDGGEKTRAIEAGADHVIHKPSNREELLIRIRSLLRIQAVRRAGRAAEPHPLPLA